MKRLMDAVYNFTAITHPFVWWVFGVFLLTGGVVYHDHFAALGATVCVSTMAILIAIRHK